MPKSLHFGNTALFRSVKPPLFLDDTMGGAYFLVLCSLGLAVTVQAQGCTRPKGSDMNLKDEFITLTEFPDGISVSFTCNVGYEAAGGSPRITCTNGVWSLLTLRCQKKSCGPAGEVENGVIDYSEGVEFGAKVTVTCNRGYDLIGKSELFCGNEGWLSRLPVCEVINCDPPSNILNGTFGPVKESYAYGDVVKYTCITDNALNGSSLLSCSDGRIFEPALPKCVYVQCPELNIPKAFWVDGSRPPYRYKSSVTYECEKEYTLKGPRTIICDINSQWSPGVPECKLTATTTTTKPPTTTTTTTTTTSSGATPGGGGGDKSYVWGIVVAVAGLLVGAAIGVKLFKDRQKKREQVFHHDKDSTNNGDAELRRLNSSDVKDDATEQMKTNP